MGNVLCSVPCSGCGSVAFNAAVFWFARTLGSAGVLLCLPLPLHIFPENQTLLPSSQPACPPLAHVPFAKRGAAQLDRTSGEFLLFGERRRRGEQGA